MEESHSVLGIYIIVVHVDSLRKITNFAWLVYYLYTKLNKQVSLQLKQKKQDLTDKLI